MKIIFFGTSIFAVPILQSLNSEHKIDLVITTPDAPAGRKRVMHSSPVSWAAEELKLNVSKPANLKTQELATTLAQARADLFVVVAYGKIIPQAVLDIPRLGSINVHGSLLPAYRGASPIQFALWNGDYKTGNTIMLMDSEVDHGPILSQDEILIDKNDCFADLENKLSHSAAKTILTTIEGYQSGIIKPKEQDHSKATFSRIISKQDGKIDWKETALQTYNRYRAFRSWPGTWTTLNDQKVKITECHIATDENKAGSPGTIHKSGLINCGNGSALLIIKLQPEGKKEMSWQNFFNGHQNITGQKFL